MVTDSPGCPENHHSDLTTGLLDILGWGRYISHFSQTLKFRRSPFHAVVEQESFWNLKNLSGTIFLPSSTCYLPADRTWDQFTASSLKLPQSFQNPSEQNWLKPRKRGLCLCSSPETATTEVWITTTYLQDTYLDNFSDFQDMPKITSGQYLQGHRMEPSNPERFVVGGPDSSLV